MPQGISHVVYTPGALLINHFPIVIRIQWQIHFAVIPALLIWLIQKFAHDMATLNYKDKPLMSHILTILNFDEVLFKGC